MTIDASIIKAVNILGSLITLAGWGICQWVWKRPVNGKILDRETHESITAIQWMLAGACGEYGWFALSRFFAPEGHTWHPIMLGLRPAALTIFLCMFVWGFFQFGRIVQGSHSRAQTMFLFLLACVAFAVGFS